MPKVTDEYRESKRREIAEAALRAFNRKGFKAASMADIISESGVSAGAIYGSFRNKADIVHEVATTMVTERLLAGEESLFDEPMPSPGEVVGIMMRGVTTTVENSDVLVQLWGEAVTDPDLREITQEIMDRIDTLYQRYLTRWYARTRDLPEADAEALAQRFGPVLVSLSQGFIIQSAIRDDFDGEAYLAAAAELFPA